MHVAGKLPALQAGDLCSPDAERRDSIQPLDFDLSIFATWALSVGRFPRPTTWAVRSF